MQKLSVTWKFVLLILRMGRKFSNLKCVFASAQVVFVPYSSPFAKPNYIFKCSVSISHSFNEWFSAKILFPRSLDDKYYFYEMKLLILSNIANKLPAKSIFSVLFEPDGNSFTIILADILSSLNFRACDLFRWPWFVIWTTAQIVYAADISIHIKLLMFSIIIEKFLFSHCKSESAKLMSWNVVWRLWMTFTRFL